jgi:predicted ATPase/DNA-binding winged helix-turn-helix (wHTH) protein
VNARRSEDPPAVRIEAENESAWCGEKRLRLSPRAFALLRHLVEHPNRLLMKEDLLAAVWRDTIVTDAALATCIRDLRKALGDSSSAPRYIQTVHRRGFRFVGPIAPPTAVASAAGAGDPGPGAREQRLSAAASGSASLVGREAELGRLRDRLERARAGQRQLIFVTGEPGMGKTALVEAFLADIEETGLRVARGQCVEQYGAGEAYLPVLEALGRLGRGPAREQMVQILMRHAPTWLVQLPGLLADGDVEAVQRRALGTTRERMLREIVEALEALTIAAPLVLLLEDLHWSDSATVDLLAMLARRRDPARLLVLGTYRPADVAGAAHPLKAVKQELEVHGHCEELPLEFLGSTAVEQFLLQRFPGHRFPPELARALHRTTDGNPLFLVNTVDYLVGQGQLREVDGRWEVAGAVEDIASRTPETLWQMVERQVERLTADERAMLTVGSVAGAEFSAAVAVADGIDTEQGELMCEALARRGQFLRAAGIAEWPDGTVAGRYAFIHTLYQQVLYARASVGDRLGLHLRTGQRLERGYAERAGEIAGELAMHFAHGRDFERAVRYRRQAGEHALRQHAYREAADHATRALDLLDAWPESPERSEQELALRFMLGAALTATHGYGALEVARTYARARELCERVGDTAQLLPVLLGLGRFHQGRGELEIARGLGARLLAIADTTRDPTVSLAAENAMGIMEFYAGEFDAALARLERGIALYDPGQHSPNRSAAFRAGQDPGVSCTVYAALTLQALGYPARAAVRMREALDLARSLDHPFSLVYTCHFAAGFHLWRREPDAVRELEGEALAHATEHGYRLFSTIGAIHRGWAMAEQARSEEGLALMREGLAALSAAGIELRRPVLLAVLAEVYGKIRRPGDGLSAVTEALAASSRTGQRHWDAELHRLKGALTLLARVSSTAPGPDVVMDGESCFLEAIEIARRQRARSFELRAATSLGRLWAGQERVAEARTLLSDVHAWFTEGFDTADLREAGALLEELEGRAGASHADRTAGPGSAAPADAAGGTA